MANKNSEKSVETSLKKKIGRNKTPKVSNEAV